MTDINTPSGSLGFTTVNKAVDGSVTGSTSTGQYVQNVVTSFSADKSAIGANSRDFLGIYEWKVYGNAQNEINELTGTQVGGSYVFADKDLTSIVASVSSSGMVNYTTDDGWETFSAASFSTYVYNAFAVGGGGNVIARCTDNSSFQCMIGPTHTEGNIIDVEDGNIQHLRSIVISEDGTKISVGHNNNSSSDYISTYFLSGNTIGSRQSRKYLGTSGLITNGTFTLTDDGEYIIGVYNNSGTHIGYTPTNDGSFFGQISYEGEDYHSQFKVTDVSPVGKSYSIPMISYRDDLGFFRFIHPADTGVGYDMTTMVQHAKIPVSSLPDDTVWAIPNSFNTMLVGVSPAGGSRYVTKMSYTPLTGGF